MSATRTDLWRMSAVELAGLIRSRRASSQEIIQAHLRRIEVVNPLVNAVTLVLGEKALEAAKAADRAVSSGADLPPLHGVPFTIKANIDLAGTPTTNGIMALAGAYPDLDAPGVARMRAAGAIPFGRTNMPDMAISWHTDSELWGATINPWARSRTPGASSGGEAAALATGMTPLGLGNDTLGSLRWPAQCCGISALKPTLGRLPHASSIEPRDLFADPPIGIQLAGVQGPMARRVADLWAAFEVMAGPSWRDPWSVPAPIRGPDPDTPLRVALVLDPAGQGTARQVQDGLWKAAAALSDAGYVVEEVEPPSIDVAAKILLDMLYPPDVRAAWQVYAPPVRDYHRQFVVALFEVASDPDPTASTRCFMIRQSLLRAWGEFQETYPLIIAPVCTDIPFEVGKDRTPSEVAAVVRSMRAAMAVNALGLPAVALPVGTGDGLPQVAQLIGPRYREDLCLDAAASVEERLGVITPIDPG